MVGKVYLDKNGYEVSREDYFRERVKAAKEQSSKLESSGRINTRVLDMVIDGFGLRD